MKNYDLYFDKLTRLTVISILILGINSTGLAQDKSSAKANKKFIREYIGDLSGKEKTAEILDKYIADSDKIFKEHILQTEASFPNYELIIEDMLAEGDKVAVRAVFKGVNRGPVGDAPATNKKVESPFIIIYQVLDGKIINHWMASDNLSFMKQLGMMQ